MALNPDPLLAAGKVAPPTLPEMLATLPSLSPTIIAALGRIARERVYPAGETIIQEGQTSESVYVLLSGSAEVVKDGHPINTVMAPCILGEIAFIDGRPRSASVTATTPCTGQVIEPSELLTQPEGAPCYDAFRSSVAVSAVTIAREQSDRLVQSLERELAASEHQRNFGRFVIYLITVLSIGALVTNIVLTGMVEVDVYSDQFIFVFGILLLLPGLLTMWVMRTPLTAMGVTLQGWRKSLFEGVLWSAVLMAASVAASYVTLQVVWLPDRPFRIVPELMLPYVISVILQEFIARGMIQNAFRQFLDDKRGYQSVLLASVIFALLHLHFGVPAFIITFLSSIVFGAFYLRHQNLIGVCILHYFAGLASIGLSLL